MNYDCDRRGRGGVSRFTQPDTIIPNPANPQDLNRYTYVRNNPATFNDPTGHCTESTTLDAEGQALCDSLLATPGFTEGMLISTARLTGRLDANVEYDVSTIAAALPSVASAGSIQLDSLTKIGDWSAVSDGVFVIQGGGTWVKTSDELARAIASQNQYAGDVFRFTSKGLTWVGYVGDGVVIAVALSGGGTTDERITSGGRAATSAAMSTVGLGLLEGSAAISGASTCGPLLAYCAGVIIFAGLAGPSVFDAMSDPDVAQAVLQANLSCCY